MTGPMNDSPRRAYQEQTQPSAGSLVGQAAAGGRAPCSEPDRALETGKRAPSEPVCVQRRGTSIRLACGCGHFVLSFHSLGIVRHGRFRCPICDREVRLSHLKALLEICRISRGGDARAFMSESAAP